jgi:hypothetical protein
MSNLTRTADYLSDALEALGFIIMSKKSGEGLPLVAFRFTTKADRHYDEFALAHKLVSFLPPNFLSWFFGSMFSGAHPPFYNIPYMFFPLLAY